MAQVNSKSGNRKSKRHEKPTPPNFVQTTRQMTNTEKAALKSTDNNALTKFIQTKL